MNVEGYEVVNELTSFRDVAALLKTNNSWVFLGTGGWHGTSMSLDDCDSILRGDHEKWLPGGAYITVFIIDPAKVSVKWGEIHLRNLNEVEYLREKVAETLEKIKESQQNNV
jgi:hypothetical protein